MIYKDFCMDPENKLDEEFIDSELDFLIDVSIKHADRIKDKTEYATIVKERYKLWLESL